MPGSDLTRREAVKVAAAAGVAVAVGGAAGGRSARAAKQQVRYGMIGTGSRGAVLLKLMGGLDNGRCVALSDIYEPNLQAAAASLAARPKLYRDYRELLADKNVDAVVVATPLFQHYTVTSDALLAGKHVFCEKSLVFKPEEVHALRALAASRPKQVLQTGLQRRYSPFYQAAKSMIEKGLVGDVTHIRAQWHRNGSGRRPVKDPKLDRQINWRFYREYSGGLTAELGSHAMDVADWFFDATPEFVMGIGGIDYWKDGRTTYDNVQLLYNYPNGRKFMYSAISTNSHLGLMGGLRREFAEVIMGTGGTIEITIADANNPAVGPAVAFWYREPSAPKLQKAGKADENWVAGATVSTTATAVKGLPLLLPADTIDAGDSFLQKEMKYARRWLYAKGVMLPEEERNPVTISLEDFFNCAAYGRRPKADLEVGLSDSTTVILSNLAMDEGRRIHFREIETMGRDVKPVTSVPERMTERPGYRRGFSYA